MDFYLISLWYQHWMVHAVIVKKGIKNNEKSFTKEVHKIDYQ